MLRHSSVSFLLACLIAACGGGSKSSNNNTTPVASTPSEGAQATAPGSTTPAETPATTSETERQNVSGTTPEPGTPGSSTSGMGTSGSTSTPGTTTGTDTSSGMTGTGTSGTTGTTGATGTGTSGTTSGSTGTGTGTADTGKGAMNEAAAVAMLDAANDHEIAVAKLAGTKSKNAAVKKFAKMMVTDHTKMKANVDKMATTLSITAEPNDAVDTLKTESSAALDKLNGMSGKEFDRAFADQMVQDHQKVLSLIDDQIKPALTSNTQFSAALDKDRPKIEQHLEQAKSLQEKLNR